MLHPRDGAALLALAPTGAEDNAIFWLAKASSPYRE
jgi:hypothetical protein